jgi:eukaryotic-like serine/threonine-protein kinase
MIRGGDSFREPGERIGPYRILEAVSSGGMGTVYRAVRDDREYEKHVALKLIKRGMDTDLIVRRFRYERQILASLQHPNIAALLDGGTTPDGLPYLVMEYIEGQPITGYADGRKLGIAARLELFRTVCAAVEYAHQNLVVHRDLKPNNILVTPEGNPKLLDFGVAKLLGPDESSGEPTTTFSAMSFLTPEYASPEQVRGDPITTQSDVYSLGVLLYRLLTAHWPYRPHGRTPEDLADAVRTQAPERPSIAIGRAGPDGLTPENVSAVREGDPAKLGRRLKGDLDTIALMALRKEPARRYGSVAQLSEDIRRHLEGRPVRAHRDTYAYRAGKFLGRNAKATLAAAVIVMSLIAGVVITAREAQRARAERVLAERRFNDVRSLADSLLFDGFEAVRNIPGTHAARRLMIRRAIEYLDSLAAEASDDLPLQSELALAYDRIRALTNTSTELELHRKALAINRSLVESEPGNRKYREQLAASYSLMGDLLRETGDSPAALANYQESLAMTEALNRENPSNGAYRVALADADELVGFMLEEMGETDRPLVYERRALSIRTALLAAAPGNADLRDAAAVSHHYIALLEADQGDFNHAFADQAQALEIAESLNAAAPRNAVYRRDLWAMHHRLGNIMALAGDPAGALAEYRKSLGYMEALSAADPGDTGDRREIAITHLDIAVALDAAGRYPEALAASRRAMAISTALLATDPEKIETSVDLATMYAQLGRELVRTGALAKAAQALDRAREMFAALARRDARNDAANRGRAGLFEYLGEMEWKLGAARKSVREARWMEARTDFERSLAQWVHMPGRDRVRRGDLDQVAELTRRLANACAALRSISR